MQPVKTVSGSVLREGKRFTYDATFDARSWRALVRDGCDLRGVINGDIPTRTFSIGKLVQSKVEESILAGRVGPTA